MNEEQARERIEELKGFYAHLAAYVAVNVCLVLLNLITSPGYLWFFFPLFGWGIGLAIHAVNVFWTGNEWEARKLEELTGLKNTQDELKRLSERTDALVTIMSSVDWENIDPELVRTRDNLEGARARVAALQTHADAQAQEEVKEEIEKLEAFVTSSKFAYYDLAAKGK
ncbi:MAG: 2TM domain-containing protein [Pseudomonadota bacterium]